MNIKNNNAITALLSGLSLTGAISLAAALNAETLTFTPKVNTSGQWTWANAENWLTAGGGNKAPAEGDDLLINTPANNYHAANASVYVQSIRFTTGALPYSGISWNGFYVKSGGAGIVVEHTGDKQCYAALYLDGEVTVNLAGGQWWQSGVAGRDATRRSRIVKLGTANLSLEKVANNNWAGATIREGQLTLKTDSGKTGIDFHFDGSAGSAKLVMGGNLTLKDGGLSSSTDLPLTNHGVYDSNGKRTLTISGTPKSTALYYAGSFNQTASFAFTPSVAGCTFTAARATSPTTGNLTVSNATFRVKDGASFPSIYRLDVKAGGVFSYGADAGSVTPTYVYLDTGAGVQVDAETVWEVARLSTNRVQLADGDYTAQNCDWVTGAGTVRVNHAKNYANPIYLDVGAGLTKTLSEALADYNAAHAGEAGFTDVTVSTLNGGADAARTLVKTGTGMLRMETPIAGFTAPVHVEAGILKSEVRYGLGKESNANAPVYVHAGATIQALTTNDALNVGRTFHIAGAGAAGYAGALVCGSDAVPNNYHLYHVFGSKLYLDADATVNVGSWVEITGTLTLNNHTLTIVGGNAGYNDSPFHITTVADNGHIVVKKGEWRLEPVVNLNGAGPDNTVTFDGRAGFRFTDNAPAGNLSKWKYIFQGSDDALYSDYHISSRNASKNVLKVPTELKSTVNLVYQGDRKRGAMVVEAPLSGTGGLKTVDGRTFFLHLLNPANSFTGGLSFQSGVIWAYPNGTVPNGADAAAVTLAPQVAPYNVSGSSETFKNFRNYFDGIAFMCPGTYALPELKVSGLHPARVQNGTGAWKKVTVSGVGGVHYYSGLGAPLLDVTKGTFKLPRAAGAGLWEGTNTYADIQKGDTGGVQAQKAYAGTRAYTNLAVRGPTMAVREEAYNYTTGLAKELVTYKGFIWNRSDADVTWTFASSMTKPVTLKIDGAAVLTAAASTLASANVTLTPGPHAFEYRTYGDDSAAARPSGRRSSRPTASRSRS